MDLLAHHTQAHTASGRTLLLVAAVGIIAVVMAALVFYARREK